MIGLIAVVSPGLVAVGLALALTVGAPLSERVVNRALVGGMAAAVLLDLIGAVVGPVDAGVVAAGVHLVGLVTASAAGRWMHRDGGFTRFHLLLGLAMFGLGWLVRADGAAGLVLGWELTGIASALLIAHLHDRPGAVRAGLRAFLTLRAPDAALILGGALLVSGGAPTFRALPALVDADPARAAAAGVLLVVAASGKAGLFPWTPWVVRAAEGPTPSSAAFYGGTALLAGPVLLYKLAPLLALPGPAVAAGVIGLGTAIGAALLARARSDVKTSHVLASVTQLGVSFGFAALGLPKLALAHAVVVAVTGFARVLRAPGWAELDTVRPRQAAPLVVREAGWDLLRLEWLHDQGAARPALDLAKQVQALDDVVVLDPQIVLDRASDAAHAVDRVLARSGLGASVAAPLERVARLFEPVEAVLAQPLAAALLAWLLIVAVT
jgi:formate hydrogenlyase subunit 3/multisubunit Na+/H+ antiporter MnhD subunit